VLAWVVVIAVGNEITVLTAAVRIGRVGCVTSAGFDSWVKLVFVVLVV
jgi:hypothetical protein